MRLILPLMLTLGLTAAACGNDATADASAPAGEPEPFECPVTLPGEGFTPPGDHPTPSLDNHVWYGSPDLYTALAVDGTYTPRKGVYWSVHFDVHEDETPPLEVTYERLDDEGLHVHEAPGTNANTSEDGWFMMNGIDPDEPGCWRVTATYLDATLVYVYER